VITVVKARVYAKYGGDISLLQRDGTPRDKAAIDAEDWSAMEMIVEELSLTKARAARGSSGHPVPRTFTRMSAEQVRQAHEETERFRAVIATESYEDVLSVLWPLAV
jgi:hypothetical protein